MIKIASIEFKELQQTLWSKLTDHQTVHSNPLANLYYRYEKKENMYKNIFKITKNDYWTTLINIPKEYKRPHGRIPQGCFLEDEKGNIYLVHRGEIAISGQTNDLFDFPEFINGARIFKVKEYDLGNSQFIFVAQLNADDFAKQVEDFILKVEQFKELHRRH